jgi:methylthioribose-1-phosphate isomerase
MLVNGTHYRTIWIEGTTVRMINQPLLPHQFEIFDCKSHLDTANAISTMIVRGAGAIGAAGGFALAQAACEAPVQGFSGYVDSAFETIRKTRPTAQNLFYSLERVLAAIRKAGSAGEARNAAVIVARAIADQDASACKQIGELGKSLIRDGAKMLTHCNAGWLAFVDWGSALSPLYAAKREGKKLFVWADETRPRCQGMFLTAWELREEQIDFAIIPDNAAGYYMKKGEVDLVIVGSDRIAANGDVANKIGTYEKAVLALENNIPFYVAAPSSTIDWECKSGNDIPIEERSEDEVLLISGLDKNDTSRTIRIAPKGVHAKNPAFDVTPACYITSIITELGIVAPGEILSIRK